MKRSGIIWLASYPKSGNTWFRVFLTNLLEEKDVPADINELHSTPIASARGMFDEAVGLEASDLTVDEIERLRPAVYAHLAEQADETIFMKVHDAYTLVDRERPLFPAHATLGAIYFIRNPLDVAVSFAHHSGWSYDKTILKMADENLAFCGGIKRVHNQLRQKLLTWSGHVQSWTRQTAFPVCVLRYEDMKTNPVDHFQQAIEFAGLDYKNEQIKRALTRSTFEELRRQEKAYGFHEKSSASKMFFRRGEAGAWQSELNSRQVAKIIRDHKTVMSQFGYLPVNSRSLKAKAHESKH